MAEEAGDFAAALRGAVAARGVSLDHLRKALAKRDVRVSAATLSYWQSGRSRPERASSLAAIGPLEECLGLPRGFLASRLPESRRPAGLGYLVGELPRTPTVQERYIEFAVGQLGLQYSDYAYVTVHDLLTVRHRREVGRDVRLILTAHRDGTDRFPVWQETGDSATFPVLTPRFGCRIGQVREFREFAGSAVEMILDRPLRHGESAMVEYHQAPVGDVGICTGGWRGVASPSREVVLQAAFVGDVPPRVWSSSTVGGDRDVVPLVPGPVVQAHFVDRPAGRFRLDWAWEEGPDD